MKDEKVVVKQIANADNPLLGAKYVGAKEYVTIKTGRDGKNITGLDENALDIMNLPAEQAKKRSSEVKKKRESLEKLLGKDLTPDSPFWGEFMLVLEDELTLDPLNPLDQLVEIVLLANRYVAPSEEAIKNDEDYHGTIFYLHREEEVLTRKAQKDQKKDAAISRLFVLHEDNPAFVKMLVADIFGFDTSIDISVDQAYLKLKSFITGEDDEDEVDVEKNIKVFMAAVKKKPEELMLKQIFNKAVKKKIVKKRGDTYSRGEEVYGKSYDEALEYLLLPENSGELAFLKSEIDD
jgi:hypothetical protein